MNNTFTFHPDRDIDESGNTNEVRANRALAALKAYAVELGQELVDDPSCVLQDLLTDLRHLADRVQLDFEQLNDVGKANHLEER